MTEPDPELVEAIVKAMENEGTAAGSSIHSWRCACYLEETAKIILAAVEPAIRADERAKIDAEIRRGYEFYGDDDPTGVEGERL